ncbi:MAG: NADH-quinone oxidoreductase subunit K, partial [Limisphaerales bacterium]
TAPVFDDVSAEVAVTDPVMQAISITDVVVGAAVLAVLLALAAKVHKRFGTLDPNNLKAIRG